MSYMQYPRQDEEEEQERIYSSDDFRMRLMKVLPCEKKYCHDWTKCPFAHPCEKATRRDPYDGNTLAYAGIACPDMRKEQRCPRGDYCPYAHNVFEYWLHPSRYRTAMCRDGEKCNRNVCFFAHDIATEYRQDVERPYVSPDDLINAQNRARMDPNVQRQYKEAGQAGQKGNKNALREISAADTGQTYEELNSQRTSLPGYQSVLAPAATSQRTDVMNALDTVLRRGNLSSSRHPSSPLQTDTGDSFPIASTPGGLALQSPERMLLNDRLSGDAEPSPSQLRESGMRLSDSNSQQSRNTMVRSGPSHQNLLNATNELSKSKLMTGKTSTGTTRTPLDRNLFSNASTIPDRRMHRRPRASNSSLQSHCLPLSNLNSQSNLNTNSTSYSLGTGHSSGYVTHGLHLATRGASDVAAQLQLEQAMSLPDDLHQSLHLHHAAPISTAVAQYQSALVREQQDKLARQHILQNSAAFQHLPDFNQGQEQASNFGQMHNFRQAMDPHQVQDFNRLSVSEMQHRPWLDLRYGGLGENQGELSQRSPAQAPRYEAISQLYPNTGSGLLLSQGIPVLSTREVEQARHPPLRLRSNNEAQWGMHLDQEELDLSKMNLNGGPFP